MKTFNATVSLFNGKYWLDAGFKGMKASKIHTAARTALENTILGARKVHGRMRVKEAIVKIQEI